MHSSVRRSNMIIFGLKRTKPVLTVFLPLQDNIPDTMLKKLKKYIDNPKFTPENVEKVSKVGRTVLMFLFSSSVLATLPSPVTFHCVGL